MVLGKFWSLTIRSLECSVSAGGTVKKSKLILFASFKPFISNPHAGALEEQGFSVVRYLDSGEMLEHLKRCGQNEPLLAVFGDMLRHGKEFSDSETYHGLATGVSLYRRVRDQHAHAARANLPVVILYTQRYIERMLENEVGSDPNLLLIREGSFDSREKLDSKEILVEHAKKLLGQ